MLQFYKQWYMLPWGFILSEKQKHNTLIPLCERFIKYLYYRSQNKNRNTSTDCLLRKNQHLSWYYFQFMLLNPICFWLFCLFGFFFLSVQACYRLLYFKLSNCKIILHHWIYFRAKSLCWNIDFGNSRFICNA